MAQGTEVASSVARSTAARMGARRAPFVVAARLMATSGSTAVEVVMSLGELCCLAHLGNRVARWLSYHELALATLFYDLGV